MTGRATAFEKRSVIRASRDQLAAYHERDGALERLMPPWERVRILWNDGPLVDGKRVFLSAKIGPVWKTWEAQHFDVIPGHQFRDRALRGPFASWTHSHTFESRASAHGGMPSPIDAHSSNEAPAFMPLPTSELIDHITYTLPFGPLGRLGANYIRNQLARMFAFRHARTANDLARHVKFADRPRLKIAISGASGAIASNLIPFLTTAGHNVAHIIRAGASSPRPDRGRSGSHHISWDATTGAIDASISDCDAIIHLAGKNIATRWSKCNRDEIYRSRVDATRKLCESLARLPRRPSTLICASAVGFYGDRGDETLDESSPRGEGFVAELCDKWERATYAAHDAGMRVVNVRTGAVISANSGAIAKLLLPAKFGMTGRLGSGSQWMPWIAMDDIVAIYDWCLNDQSVEGPVNGVTGSVRQGDFMKTLGRVLHRLTLAPLPAFGVKTIFGQMGKELLLASANVQPTRLGKAGFMPTFETLESALRFELGR